MRFDASQHFIQLPASMALERYVYVYFMQP